MRKSLAFFMTLLAAMSVRAEPSPDPFSDPVVLEIQATHTRSEQGDKQATQDLITKLEPLAKEHPDNALYLAYLGSAYTLASRDAFPGPSKLDYLKKGLATMDQAVEKSPNEIAPRFIRAVNNFQLPAFINRRDNARADFEILVGQLETTEQQLNPTTRQAIYYFAGLAFKQLHRKTDARTSWEKGLAIDSSTDLSQKINTELKKLGS